MARLAALDAQAQGFATSFVVVSDNDLHFQRSDDVYRKVVTELSTKTCPRGALGDPRDPVVDVRWRPGQLDAPLRPCRRRARLVDHPGQLRHHASRRHVNHGAFPRRPRAACAARFLGRHPILARRRRCAPELPPQQVSAPDAPWVEQEVLAAYLRDLPGTRRWLAHGNACEPILAKVDEPSDLTTR